MGISLKIILHSKTYDDGTQPVMLQCIKSSPAGNVWKRRMICKVQAHQFDKKAGLIIKHPNQTLLNLKITKAFNEAQQRLLTWELQDTVIDPAAVIAPDGPPAHLRPMFLAYGRQYVERTRMKNQLHTAEKYNSHLTKLAEYLGKDKEGHPKDIALEEITEDWILKWSAWLRNNGTKSENTMHRRMAFINTLFLDAIKRGQLTKNPMAFLAFKGQRVRKPKLTMEELGLLQDAPLSGTQDDARNTFLLQFFTYGTRISDALTWKKADVYRRSGQVYLDYTSRKTNSLISVRLHPVAVTLVEYYEANVLGPFLLPWLADYRSLPNRTDQQNVERLTNQISAKTATINGELKLIAHQIGLPIHLTTHIARHTFATLADSRIADKRKISAALGHSRFATTETYLAELQQGQVNDAMEAVWD